MAKRKKRIVLIDADIIAFRCAAAAESRSVEVIHKPSGRSKIFTTRTAFKASLKVKNFEFKPEDYDYVDIQSEEGVENALHSVKLNIERIIKDTEADASRVYVGGEGNFRNNLPLPSKYKGNRPEMRPVHLAACKDYCISRLGGILVNLREVDDEQVIDGNYFLGKGWEVYLASSDKDSFAYSGMYSYDFTQDNPIPKLIPDFGELYIREKQKDVKGWGFKWFCHQWAVGDSTDNLNPSEIAKVKFGEKSSFKLLDPCTSKQECFDVVQNLYKQWYPKDFEYLDWTGEQHKANHWSIMQLYFRGVRMKSTKDDQLILSDFLDKEGIKYDKVRI